MRKDKKKSIQKLVHLIREANEEICKQLLEEKKEVLYVLLEDCQNAALQIGNVIESEEGEDASTIVLLEEYCELIYHIYMSIDQEKKIDVQQVRVELDNVLNKIENSINNDLEEHIEVLFLPYKASMWDSLESIWKEANEDPRCRAYVVPIPYYDRNANGTLEKKNYEGNLFPQNVPITLYTDYDLKERTPDIIYIHNPYDYANLVTSIDPNYYSEELKKYTKCLVYVPYYATTGGMGGIGLVLPVYISADYIVLQSEKYKKFFSNDIPDEKFLSLGSPKFDKVASLKKEELDISVDWKEKIKGKKVYFYNTTIGEMLNNTPKFLEKMMYIFDVFSKRNDSCILWRPHPLLETTFQSMRKEYYEHYLKIKKFFLTHELGIYDDTPDIERSIALSDAYIGDGGSSVVALFGVAGKPIFVLNPYIHRKPKKDEWKAEVVYPFLMGSPQNCIVTSRNHLYYAKNSYDFHFVCELSEYSTGFYFIKTLEVNGKKYICPGNAQELLVLNKEMSGIEKRIFLDRCIEQAGAFYNAWAKDEYIFLIPNQYPFIVRYDTKKEKIDYISGYNQYFSKNVGGQYRGGGSCIWGEYLLISSPNDTIIVAIHTKTLEVTLLTTGAKNECGCFDIVQREEELWLLPYSGTTITCWNPSSGDVKEYHIELEGFYCIQRPNGYQCMEKPFFGMAFYDKKAIISPFWANMFIQIDTESGEIKKWDEPFQVDYANPSEYFFSWGTGRFLNKIDKETYQFYYEHERKLYEINMRTKEYSEIPIVFEYEEVKEKEPGFCKCAEWMVYGCYENTFNTLSNFLGNEIVGQAFSKESQLEAYSEITNNMDGTCGKKIYQYTSEKVYQREE